MSADDQPDKPEDVIARAKRELAERMFARMQEDDEQDDRDGIDSGEASKFDSDDEWDLSGRSSSARPSQGRGSTSVDDLAASLGSGTLAEGVPKPKTTLHLSSEVLEESVEGDTTAGDGPRAPRYRPQRRPPTPLLFVWDDGGVDAERFRLRKASFDVGRVDGDVVIAHDQQMSRRHFRIERNSRGKGDNVTWEWRVRDLGSLNGTFLQQRSASIGDGDEMLLGGEVIRIKQSRGDASLVLTKVGVGDDTERVTLEPGQHVLGADPSLCTHFMAEAPLLAPQHLELKSDRSRRWVVTAMPGTDGVWTRQAEFLLENGLEWQAGEQRFSFLLP